MFEQVHADGFLLLLCIYRVSFLGFFWGGGTVFAFEVTSCAVGNESNQVEHIVGWFAWFTEVS